MRPKPKRVKRPLDAMELLFLVLIVFWFLFAISIPVLQHHTQSQRPTDIGDWEGVLPR